jgi:hypothetical protein
MFQEMDTDFVCMYITSLLSTYSATHGLDLAACSNSKLLLKL